jgi:hypothetical protein
MRDGKVERSDKPPKGKQILTNDRNGAQVGDSCHGRRENGCRSVDGGCHQGGDKCSWLAVVIAETRLAQNVGVTEVVGQIRSIKKEAARVPRFFRRDFEDVIEAFLASGREHQDAETALASVLIGFVEPNLTLPIVDVFLGAHALGAIVELHKEVEGLLILVDEAEAAVGEQTVRAEIELHGVLAAKVGEPHRLPLRGYGRVHDEVSQRLRVMVVSDRDFVEEAFGWGLCVLAVENAKAGQGQLVVAGRASLGRRGVAESLGVSRRDECLKPATDAAGTWEGCLECVRHREKLLDGERCTQERAEEIEVARGDVKFRGQIACHEVGGKLASRPDCGH